MVEGFTHVSGVAGINPYRVEQKCLQEKLDPFSLFELKAVLFVNNFHFGHGNIHVKLVNLTLKDSKFLEKLLRYN